jgi:2-amino-4,5-dihydroxy-6-oxo-7-(phosphooxy)heptanoate synthase
MISERHFARSIRLHRLRRWPASGMVVVPLDHPVSDGAVLPAGTTVDGVVRDLAHAGVDAVVLHKGSLRHVRPTRFASMSLILHLSASTAHAPDPDAKVLVTSVEEAIRLGADAVSVHVNLGSREERRQLRDLGTVADECDRWNLPLLAMVYPRGPGIADPRDPALVAHAAMVAAELGADYVKTPYPGSVEDLRRVTEACPIPLLTAGGPPMATERAVLDFVDDSLRGGAAGVAMGRNIFQSENPRRLAERVARLAHQVPGQRNDATGVFHNGHQQAVLA